MALLTHIERDRHGKFKVRRSRAPRSRDAQDARLGPGCPPPAGRATFIAMPRATVEHVRLSDGYEAAVRWWRPANPRGVVLYLHGIQSHGGWYEASGDALADAGFAVMMPDRRGSGLNAAERGHVASVERCVADADDLLEEALKSTGEAAAHLVGVSWGGRLAVVLAAKQPRRVRTITLVAPGLFPRVDLTRAEKFRVAVSLIGDRNRLFDIPLNEPSLFTSNPERQAFVRADPYKLTQVTSCFLLASRRLDRRIRAFDRAEFRGPIHLFLAGRDRIIDNERTRAWLRRLPSPDRRITEYPGAAHTIEFEPDAENFLTELSRWMVEWASPM